MLFKPGDILRGKEAYKLEKLLCANGMPEDHFEHYREEWLACLKSKPDQHVVVTVISPSKFSKAVKSVVDPYTEIRLAEKLHAGSFLRFRETPDVLPNIDNSILHWYVTDYVAMETFEQFVARGEKLSKKEKWGLICDVMVGLKEINHAMPKACHLNINPETVMVHTDEKGKRHAILRGLNYVAVPSEESTSIDKSQLRPDFLPPETPVRPLSAASMQFNMALFMAWFLSGGSHPWKLTKVMPRYDAYKAMRATKPGCKLSQGLEEVLRKALLINPENRYPSFDAFATAALKSSGMSLAKKYSCLDNSKSDSAPESKPAMRGETISAGKETTFNFSGERPKLSSSHSPAIKVDIAKKSGKGFAAVAGMTALKDDLRRDFIDVVNNLKLAREYGIRVPSLMLYGPPGTGKTYIATRLAEELGIDFTMVTPSDLASVYIHGTQSLIAQLFEKAEKKAKANKKGVLLVFDEMDAICPERSSDNEHQAGEVAELLTQLNNCTERGIYVIGTTNRIDRVDKAILRKGRLDKTVYVGLPDADARKDLLRYELTQRPHSSRINLSKLVDMTDGFTSSDISYAVMESARRSFAKAVRVKASDFVKIGQKQIEEVIRSMSPSVSAADLRHYERMRREFATSATSRRDSVGFVI